MITERSKYATSLSNDTATVNGREAPGYFSVRCPACCARKDAPCRNKYGASITNVHYLRAVEYGKTRPPK